MTFQVKDLMVTVRPIENFGDWWKTRVCEGCTHTMPEIPGEPDPSGDLGLLRQHLKMTLRE